MAKTNDLFIGIIENLIPDQILSTHNIFLPGMPEEIHQLPILEKVPPKSNSIIKLFDFHTKTIEENFPIEDICSLSSSFSNHFSFEYDLIAVCGGQRILVLNEELSTVQEFHHSNDSEEAICLN